MASLASRVGNRVGSWLGLPQPLEGATLLGHELVVRRGTIRAQADYDDAWVLACARHAKVVFDIGANVGYDALIALLAGVTEQVVLVEANPRALCVAAENLILNHHSAKCRFVSAFAGDADSSVQEFWTTGTGAAGSMYRSHAKTAAKQRAAFPVPTTTVDALCETLSLAPDLVKVDVEGAEHRVLLGSSLCARQQRARFIVELHSNPDLPMVVNCDRVLAWCESVGYAAWYLARGSLLRGGGRHCTEGPLPCATPACGVAVPGVAGWGCPVSAFAGRTARMMPVLPVRSLRAARDRCRPGNEARCSDAVAAGLL